MDSLDGFNMFF